MQHRQNLVLSHQQVRRQAGANVLDGVFQETLFVQRINDGCGDRGIDLAEMAEVDLP